MVATLAITPLRKLLHLPDLIRFRRMIGLFAFFYASLHFATWFGLDKFFDMHEILADFTKRPLHHRRADGIPLMAAAGRDIHQGLDPPSGRAALAGCCIAWCMSPASPRWCIIIGW